MTLKYFANKITGLSTDTKPTNVSEGIFFVELDTKKQYVFSNNTWILLDNNIKTVFNVKDYGALGNNSSNDTTAIRNAIEDARTYSVNNNAVVTVYFPRGTYLTQQLVIYSNMMFLGDGPTSMIKRIDTSFGYPNVSTTISGGDIGYTKSFIKNYYFGADTTKQNTNITFKNIAIHGNGMIFAKDNPQVGDTAAQNKHNFLVYLKRCSNITYDNVYLYLSMNFHSYFRQCSNIYVKSVIVDGYYQTTWPPYPQPTNIASQDPRYRNNQDGLHFRGSNNITIDYYKCIVSGDDSLVLAADKYASKECYNVYIKYAECSNPFLGRGTLIEGHGNYDTHDIFIDTLVINNWNSRAVAIYHDQDQPNTDPDRAGIPRDIVIDKLIVNSIGTSSNPRLLHITTHPTELYNTGKGASTQRARNITVNYLQQNIDMSNQSTSYFRSILIEGANNVSINKFTLIGKSNNGEDINVAYSNYVTLRNGYIKRVIDGGSNIINVNTVNKLFIDNVFIPLLESEQKEGGYGLYIRGNSRYNTVVNCIFNTNTKSGYDNSVPQDAISTNTIDIG